MYYWHGCHSDSKTQDNILTPLVINTSFMRHSLNHDEQTPSRQFHKKAGNINTNNDGFMNHQVCVSRRKTFHYPYNLRQLTHIKTTRCPPVIALTALCSQSIYCQFSSGL